MQANVGVARENPVSDERLFMPGDGKGNKQLRV